MKCIYMVILLWLTLLNINYSQEVELLRQEKLEIDQQLRSIHGNEINSLQTFPTQRRNERYLKLFDH